MRAAGPVVDPIPCSGCGKLLDPLRAGHVAIFDQQFHYFCNFDTCRTAYVARTGGADSGNERRESHERSRRTLGAERSPNIEPRRRVQAEATSTPSGQKAGPVSNALAPVVPEDVLPDVPSSEEDRGLFEPIGQATSFDAIRHDPPEPREFGALLLLIAVIAGALPVLLALAGGGSLVLGARVMLAAVATGMLLARALTTPRDVADAHAAAVLAGPLLGVGVAAWAMLSADASIASEAASLAGTIATSAAISAWLLESARTYVHAERAWVEAALRVGGRLDPDTSAVDAPTEPVFDLRPGEAVVVEADEDVPVDLTVTEGEVDVLPWLGATSTTRRRPGDAIVAGAHAATT